MEHLCFSGLCSGYENAHVRAHAHQLQDSIYFIMLDIFKRSALASFFGYLGSSRVLCTGKEQVLFHFTKALLYSCK